MKLINGTRHYTAAEIVELLNAMPRDKYGVRKDCFTLLRNIDTLSGLRALFSRYGYPESVTIGNSEYYSWNPKTLEGSFEDWADAADTQRSDDFEEKVLECTGYGRADLTTVDEIIGDKISAVTFYAYLKKIPNAPRKFKVGHLSYFLRSEVDAWKLQIPAFTAKSA
jgi:predicted DNA-binding transcriptional regulator AlpA